MDRNPIVRKCLAVGIILLFVATGVIPAIAQNIEKPSLPTSRGNWLYVGGSGPGNYTRIQDAINDSSDGDTVFVYDDSSPYCEEITIEKSINLIGENHNTIIEGMTEESTSITVRTDYVTISCFSIINSHVGVKTDSGNYTMISNIHFINNFFGIILDSNYNVVSNNYLLRNDYHGVTLSGASNNLVSQNEITESWCGIYSAYTSNCTISKNRITKNDNGMIFTDVYESHYNVDNVIVQYNNITDNSIGIYIIGKFKDGVIENNNFINNNRSFFYKIFTQKKFEINANFWGKTKLLPKVILGFTLIYLYSYYDFPAHETINVFLPIPKIIFDWHPAQEPYDIG